MIDKKAKILIVDGNFNTGEAIRMRFFKLGFKNVLVWFGDDYSELQNWVREKFSIPDYVIFVGAVSGGVKFNINYPADLIDFNLSLQLPMIPLAPSNNLGNFRKGKTYNILLNDNVWINIFKKL